MDAPLAIALALIVVVALAIPAQRRFLKRERWAENSHRRMGL